MVVSAECFSQVLVVEDNAAERKLLCRMIEGEGFQVVGCGSAREALECVRKRGFGAAVVDHRLPDWSGTQLLEQIRRLDDHVRVIIYTGPASYDSVKEALNVGAFAYVERLSDRKELLRHIHRAFHERVGRYALDLEYAVAARTEELARSNRELDDFASVVAHDLRSPLVTISGYCQLVQEEYGRTLDPTGRDYLAEIVRGASRMNRLIDDLLEYSRAGMAKEPLQTVAMQWVVQQAVANLEAAIRKEGATIEVGVMPTVLGDPTQLVQLMQNLLGNALKFRRDEAPRIRISAASDSEGWQFAVQDNGIGIGSQDYERIFQTFQRLCGSDYPGNGIGLAICRKIVDRHKGRIWLSSVMGQGSTFHVYLPKTL